jgi:hypothetical protein
VLPGSKLADCKSERIDQRWHYINDSFVSMLHNDNPLVGTPRFEKRLLSMGNLQEAVRGAYSNASAFDDSTHQHSAFALSPLDN